MGFNRTIWLPGRGRADAPAPGSDAVAKLRAQREQRARDRFAARALEGSLISLAALIGTDVKDSLGTTVGRLDDVVVRWTKSESHPAVTSIVIHTGKSKLVVGARWVTVEPPRAVRLRSSAAYTRAAERHAGDVALAHDVLDRQVVDVAGVQCVRPADVYLATVRGRVELVGLEVGARALLRRLGPARFRARYRPEKVIDWATIRAFTPARADGAPSRGRRSDLAGTAGAGLMLDAAAGGVAHLNASDIQAALAAASTDAAAESQR